MIRRPVWDDYRGRIDLAVIAAAWPEFACRHRNRGHWLFGGLGPLSAEIPAKVARGPRRAGHLRQPVRRDSHDDPRARPGSGRTRSPTGSPARSSICDGRRSAPMIAGSGPADFPLGSHHSRSPKALYMRFYVPVGSRGTLFRIGMVANGVMGSLTYWYGSRRRSASPATDIDPAVRPRLFKQQAAARLARGSTVVARDLGD